MSLPIQTIIQRICPNLYADAGLTDWISMATDRTSAAWFGGNYNVAVALRAAHEYTLTVTRPNGSGGAVVSEGEASQSRSYSKGGAVNPDDLEQTYYGVRLKTLRKASNSATGVVTGMPQPTIPASMNNWPNW